MATDVRKVRIAPPRSAVRLSFRNERGTFDRLRFTEEPIAAWVVDEANARWVRVEIRMTRADEPAVVE